MWSKSNSSSIYTIHFAVYAHKDFYTIIVHAAVYTYKNKVEAAGE
jgi:hypothetical protein